MKVTTSLLDIRESPQYTELVTDAALYRLIALGDDLIRVRCTFEEQFPQESSYALVLTAWADRMDGVIRDRVRVEPLVMQWVDQGDHYAACTSKLTVKVRKQPFAIVIEDREGRVLHEDIANRGYVREDSGRLQHYTALQDDEFYYGFGEKSGVLNKRNRRLRMRNVDTIGYNSESTDPLYKHIPFYLKWNGKQQIASGIYYHNTHESLFDVGCERSGYWPKYMYYSAEGGELDYFFLYGPSLPEVVRRYTDLTGKTALPPKYALGYMGSTMYYTELEERSDNAIAGFLERCREEGIPCDGFFMSSGYTTGEDGKRYVFNWNDRRFPDPAAFAKVAANKGAALAPNVKPGMLVSNPLYPAFAEQGLYVQDASGEKPEIDRYWGGAASFVDFSNPQSRALWKHYLKERLLSQGITAIWNDNNEYEIQRQDAHCHYEGAGANIGALASVMPNLMALTAVEAIAEHDPDLRPYVVNRAGYAGIQRYAQTWAGDNNTSWHSLKYNIPLILGMGLSGVANQGCDIGGFFGPAPEPELFVRWVQNGIFQPRFSIHSSNTDNTVTEPWMYPGYTSYVRDAIALRYQLVPYYYSLLHEAATVGSPIMRPLVYEFPADEQVWEESFEFMAGPSLLVANILEAGADQWQIYLPQGAEWVEWHSKRRYCGGQTITMPVTLGSIPMFIRSGGIIPLAPGLFNIHQDRSESMKLVIEGSDRGSFALYEDDGVSVAYRQGAYRSTQITVEPGDTTVLSFSHSGTYSSPVRTIELELICEKNSPVQVALSGTSLTRLLDERGWSDSNNAWYYDVEQRVARIRYTCPTADYQLHVDFSVKDLISI